MATEGSAGVTPMERSTGVAVRVVEPLTDPSVALMSEVGVPVVVLAAVANPLESIVAIVELALDHVAVEVRFSVEPSE